MLPQSKHGSWRGRASFGVSRFVSLGLGGWRLQGLYVQSLDQGKVLRIRYLGTLVSKSGEDVQAPGTLESFSNLPLW